MINATRSALLLIIPFFLMPQTVAAETSAPAKSPYLSFGTRLGEETTEGFADLIYPLVGTDNNLLFFNPRFSLKDEGVNEANIGLGYRRRLANWLVGGANLYFDSRESEHNNRFNQWGAGLELLTEYVDFRANYYDADNSKELIGSYSETLTESTTTRTSYNYGTPWATNHEIVISKTGIERTTTTVTSMFFEQFEAGMDGWDAEIGCKLPLDKGPEVRLFAGYYDYDNSLGEDFSGGKGRLEIKTGSWLTLDAEVFEDEALNDTDYFVGFRLQVPLTRDLSWQSFKDGLLSSRHRDLDQRMRSEMVIRDVRVQTDESDWQENLARRQITQSVKKRKTTSRIILADHITFVDGDTSGVEDGTNENPYSTIQEGVDNAGDNNTIFVYEAGGTATGKPGAADGGGAYDEQVVLQEGQTLTSTISWSSHGGGSYQTLHPPVIRPTAVSVEQQAEIYGISFTIAPIISMAADTVVRRMELDATATDFAAYGSLSGNKISTGLYANIRKTTDTTLRVEDNHIVTEGDASFGLGILADDSTNAAITLSATDISTRGELSRGIFILADNSVNPAIDLSTTTISTAGDDSIGAFIRVNGSANAAINLAETEITTAGEDAHGMGVIFNDSTNAAITLSATTISTAGDGADGLYFHASGSTGAVINLAETAISTEGDDAEGIYIGASYSTDAVIHLAETAISTAGDDAEGIDIYAQNSTGPVIHLTETYISTAGEDAQGIDIDVDDSANAAINLADAEIGTQGDDAQGIFIHAENAASAAIDLANAEITTAGARAYGLNIFANLPITNSIKDNIFAIIGPDSWGIRIGNGTGSFNQTALEAENIFYIDDPSSGTVSIYTP